MLHIFILFAVTFLSNDGRAIATETTTSQSNHRKQQRHAQTGARQNEKDGEGEEDRANSASVAAKGRKDIVYLYQWIGGHRIYDCIVIYQSISRRHNGTL